MVLDLAREDVLTRLQDFGIKETHARILLQLHREGHMTKQQVMNRTGLTAPVVEEAADKFEASGWLTKTDEPLGDRLGRPERGYELETTLSGILDDILRGMENHARQIEDELD